MYTFPSQGIYTPTPKIGVAGNTTLFLEGVTGSGQDALMLIEANFTRTQTAIVRGIGNN